LADLSQDDRWLVYGWIFFYLQALAESIVNNNIEYNPKNICDVRNFPANKFSGSLLVVAPSLNNPEKKG
jgi:hypothetical protein